VLAQDASQAAAVFLPPLNLRLLLLSNKLRAAPARRFGIVFCGPFDAPHGGADRQQNLALHCQQLLVPTPRRFHCLHDELLQLELRCSILRRPLYCPFAARAVFVQRSGTQAVQDVLSVRLVSAAPSSQNLRVRRYGQVKGFSQGGAVAQRYFPSTCADISTYFKYQTIQIIQNLAKW